MNEDGSATRFRHFPDEPEATQMQPMPDGEWIAFADHEEVRRRLAEQTELIAKGTEAMGAIRFVAGFLGLAGPTWSEEPGFAEKFTEAFLEQHRQLAEDRARLDWVLENAISITVHNPRHAGMALVIIQSRESIDAVKGGQG